MAHVCIHCGLLTDILFKEYSSTVLKIHVCDACGEPVDKYVEYETAVILMDISLQKVEAFRHILFNSGIKDFWKLGILSVIINAYIQWNHCLSTSSSAPEDLKFELDWTFYLVCLRSAFEFTIYIVAVMSITFFFNRVHSPLTSITLKTLLNGLLLANFGQVLALPTIIWNEAMHQLYLWLTLGFVVLSNIQAYRAITCRGKLYSLIVVMFGFSARFIASATYL